MELSTALATDLRLLTTAIDLDEQSLVIDLDGVLAHAKVAVPSFVGLRIVVVSEHCPVQLTVFEPGVEPDQIASSIEIPLSIVASTDAGSRITFYATVAGAFVDLAADLSYALGLPDPELGGSTPGAIRADGTADSGSRVVVDLDLRPDTTGPAITGLQEASAVNRAIGALIDGGHHPDAAHGELDRRASVSGLTTAGYAAAFIKTFSEPDPVE